MFAVSTTDGTVFYTGADAKAAKNIFDRAVSSYRGDGRRFNIHVLLTLDNLVMLSEAG